MARSRRSNAAEAPRHDPACSIAASQRGDQKKSEKPKSASKPAQLGDLHVETRHRFEASRLDTLLRHSDSRYCGRPGVQHHSRRRPSSLVVSTTRPRRASVIAIGGHLPALPPRAFCRRLFQSTSGPTASSGVGGRACILHIQSSTALKRRGSSREFRRSKKSTCGPSLPSAPHSQTLLHDLRVLPYSSQQVRPLASLSIVVVVERLFAIHRLLHSQALASPGFSSPACC